MERHDVEFDLTYSFHLESMFGTLTGRIDKLITLITIVAGFSIFSSISGYMWYGGLIAIMSVAQIVYQFSRASGISDEQARKYQNVIIEMPQLSNEDLFERYKELQKTDSKPWGVLKNAAHKRTCIQLGREDNIPPLTALEKVFSFIAGDLPRSK